MSDGRAKFNDLDALLREHGGVDGLARELGQHDPTAWLDEGAANENEPRERVGLWRRLWALLEDRSLL